MGWSQHPAALNKAAERWPLMTQLDATARVLLEGHALPMPPCPQPTLPDMLPARLSTPEQAARLGCGLGVPRARRLAPRRHPDQRGAGPALPRGVRSIPAFAVLLGLATAGWSHCHAAEPTTSPACTSLAMPCSARQSRQTQRASPLAQLLYQVCFLTVGYHCFPFFCRAW